MKGIIYMKLIINQILEYIQENIFLLNLKVEDIAEHFGYDKYYFSSEFKKITGFSLNEYISSLRSAKAIDLINEKGSVIDIQTSVGYSSSGTFSNVFKKYTGSSPQQYKNEMDYIYNAVKTFEESENNKVEYYQDISESYCNVDVEVPDNLKNGIIFIGLFHTPIPNHKPISGLVTKKNKNNKLKNIPRGNYYLLVCAINSTDGLLSYFNLKNCLRRRVEEKLSFPEDSKKEYTVRLRPPIPEDPPILINLAKLLVSSLRKNHNVE